jgi:hypothetical protein
MPLPTIPRQRIRPAGQLKSRPPVLWRDLTLEHQTQVAHILAVLVRRLHQQQRTEEPRVEHA